MTLIYYLLTIVLNIKVTFHQLFKLARSWQESVGNDGYEWVCKSELHFTETFVNLCYKYLCEPIHNLNSSLRDTFN